MYQVYAACGSFSFGECKTITSLAGAISSSFFAVIWFVAIVFLAYGGLLYITSAGDKTKAEKAQTALTNALIGIVIVLSLNVLTSVVGNLLTGGGLSAPSLGSSLPINS